MTSVSDQRFTDLRAAGYTGSMDEMLRQYYLAGLSLSEPQDFSLQDLTHMYLATLGSSVEGTSTADMFVANNITIFP